MRKLAALVLALCMLPAAMSALGEDFTGTWYWVMAEVTMGRMELNADGTSALDVTINGQNFSGSGTWEAAEDGLTVVIDGDPMPMAYDAATGVMTCSLIPISMVREAGKFDADTLIKAMQGDVSGLPEGVTEEEIKAVIVNFTAEMMLFQSSLAGGAPDDGIEEGMTAD